MTAKKPAKVTKVMVKKPTKVVEPPAAKAKAEPAKAVAKAVIADEAAAEARYKVSEKPASNLPYCTQQLEKS